MKRLRASSLPFLCWVYLQPSGTIPTASQKAGTANMPTPERRVEWFQNWFHLLVFGNLLATAGPKMDPKMAQKLAQKLVKVGSIFGQFCWTTFGQLFGPFWGTILGPDRPKRGRDVPKRGIKSFEVPKTCICKNLNNIGFKCFWGPRLSKTASEGQRRLPRGT